MNNVSKFLINFLVALKLFIPVGLGSALSDSGKTQDMIWADDKEYRENSWVGISDFTNYPVHKELAEDVVFSHELCESNDSNIAAFGFSLYGKDRKIKNYVKFHVMLSSGKVIQVHPFLKISTVNDFFTGRNSIYSPKQQMLAFINNLQTNKKLVFNKIEEVKRALEKQSDSNSIRLEDNPLDVHLGYIKHCEQCFIFDLLTSQKLNDIADVLRLKDITEGDYVSFDILTYNDMCQRCFAGCKIFKEKLENMLYKIVNRNIPLKIYISSLRPFEIVVDKDQTNGYTRGEITIAKFNLDNVKQCKALPKDRSKLSILEETLLNSFDVVQFFNPWMLDAQTKLLYKLIIRAAEESLIGKRQPFWEPISRETMKLNKVREENCLNNITVLTKNMLSEFKSEFKSEVKTLHTEVQDGISLLTKEINSYKARKKALQQADNLLNSLLNS